MVWHYKPELSRAMFSGIMKNDVRFWNTNAELFARADGNIKG